LPAAASSEAKSELSTEKTSPLSSRHQSDIYTPVLLLHIVGEVLGVVAAMGERRLPAGACLLAVAMVLQAAAVVLVLGEESDGAGALLDPRQLEKFVDELPDMPRLRGYGVTEGGALVAGNLTIGMYDTTWVSTRNMSMLHVPYYLRSWRRGLAPPVS